MRAVLRGSVLGAAVILAIAALIVIALRWGDARAAAAASQGSEMPGTGATNAFSDSNLAASATPTELAPVDGERAPALSGAASAATFDVLGLVLDELGHPVERFGLRATRFEEPWPRPQRDSKRRVETREVQVEEAQLEIKREWPIADHPRGEFELHGLQTACWELEPFADDMTPEWSFRICEPTSERILFVLDSKALVRGIVLDPDARPIAGAEISIDGRAAPEPTDASGGFQIAIAPGEHALIGRAQGFLPSAPVELAVGRRERVEHVELVVRRGGALRGVVLDETGLPISDCELIALARPDVQAKTDLRGRFELDGLSPGLAALSLFVPTPASATPERWSGTALIEAERTTEITIRIARERPVRVVGRIEIAGDSRAAYGSRICAVPIDGQFVRGSGADALAEDDGRFELELSSPGRYRFDRLAMFSEEITSVVVDVPDRDVFELTLKP